MPAIGPKIIITSGEVLNVRCVGFLGRDLGPSAVADRWARAPATQGSGKPDKHEQPRVSHPVPGAPSLEPGQDGTCPRPVRARVTFDSS